MSIFPISVGMTGGDELLLHVGAINEQLCHSAARTIRGDAADANGATDDQ